MTISARYVHTNLIAHDWRSLARFYQDVFGCVPVPPERELSGPEMAAGTGIAARICAASICACRSRRRRADAGDLQLQPDGGAPADRGQSTGFGHLAFSVENVAAARETVLAAGGQPVGRS